MLTQDEVIALARKEMQLDPAAMGNSDPAYTPIAVLMRFAQACYEAGAKAENEACAITAWNHCADECKRSGLNPCHFGDWCAATAIRERMK